MTTTPSTTVQYYILECRSYYGTHDSSGDTTDELLIYKRKEDAEAAATERMLDYICDDIKEGYMDDMQSDYIFLDQYPSLCPVFEDFVNITNEHSVSRQTESDKVALRNGRDKFRLALKTSGIDLSSIFKKFVKREYVPYKYTVQIHAAEFIE